ncbi:hypothetical protein GCM10009804_66470 [Kribbella hippodromi]|uniref:Uncharacterized protein n=1 Tax=Kribbella hippodromi TaxID=434347 RepID=A0ABN2EC85_9ACTN
MRGAYCGVAGRDCVLPAQNGDSLDVLAFWVFAQNGESSVERGA